MMENNCFEIKSHAPGTKPVVNIHDNTVDSHNTNGLVSEGVRDNTIDNRIANGLESGNIHDNTVDNHHISGLGSENIQDITSCKQHINGLECGNVQDNTMDNNQSNGLESENIHTACNHHINGLESGNIQDNTVDNHHINGLESGNIQDNTVDNHHINGLESGNIQDSTVDNHHINGLESGNIQDNTVDNHHISALESENIQESAVDNHHISGLECENIQESADDNHHINGLESGEQSERSCSMTSWERIIRDSLANPTTDCYLCQAADGQVLRLVDIDGIPYIPINNIRETVKSIKSSFRARPADVFLATYPRSGTHWVWEIMNMLLTKDFTLTPNYHKEEHHLEFHPPTRFEDGGDHGRVFNTHFNYNMMPRSVFQNQCKVVVLMRHPLELAVSYYHLTKDQEPLYKFQGSWDTFFKMFMEGTVERGSWFDFVLNWWENGKDLDHVYFTTFAEVKKDMASFCRSLAEFLDVPITSDEIQAIKDATDIQKMRSHKACENVSFVGEVSGLVGTGKTLSAQKQYSKAQREELQKMMNERLGDSDLRLKFNMNCMR